MSELNRSEEELELIELARRVLPAGSFGNLPGDIVIRDGAPAQTASARAGHFLDRAL